MTRIKEVCPKCGRSISKSNITKHLNAHETNPGAYNKTVSYALTHDGLTCQFCSKEYKNKNSLCNHERLCQNNPNKQVIDRSYLRNGISRTAWNKGLTAETDDRVRANREGVRRFHRENPNLKRNPLTEEHKAKIRSSVNARVKNGTWHASLARDMHYDYNGVDLHGSWEVSYAEWLDANSIKWERPSNYFLYTFDGAVHRYTPDFYLTDLKQYVEIKGYKTAKDEAKWDQFPKDTKLVVLMESDLKALGISIRT